VLEFQQRYLDRDDDNHVAIDANPCFYLEDSRCMVYVQRPQACCDYPYIGGDVRSGMVGILERAATCPIIYEMLEQLKNTLGFYRYD